MEKAKTSTNSNSRVLLSIQVDPKLDIIGRSLEKILLGLSLMTLKYLFSRIQVWNQNVLVVISRATNGEEWVPVPVLMFFFTKRNLNLILF